MKTFKIYTFLLFICLGASCSSDDIAEDVTEKDKPVKLDKLVAKVDHLKTSDCIKILEGNGGYEVHVKNVLIYDEYKDIPFENHTLIQIEGDKILISRILLEEFIMIATCVVVDSQGMKETFTIENTTLVGK